MFSGIASFLTGLFYFSGFALLFALGLFLVMGFYSAKGMFRRLRNGDMFRGGRANYRSGYNHQSRYNDGYYGGRGRDSRYYGSRGYGSRGHDGGYDYEGDYRGEYGEPRGGVMADHFEYELGRYQANRAERKKHGFNKPAFSMNIGNSSLIKNFRSPQSFKKFTQDSFKEEKVEPIEDYVAVKGDKETAVSSVKEILCGIYNETDTIVCNRQEIVEAVQTLQSGEIGSIKALSERSKHRFYQFGISDKELFVIIKSNNFDFKEALALDSPKEFLARQANVVVNDNVKTTLLKTSLFDFKGDIHGCRFVFVGDLQVSTESLATNLSKGTINSSVSAVVKENEVNEDFEPVSNVQSVKPIERLEMIDTEPIDTKKTESCEISAETHIGRIQETQDVTDNKETLATKIEENLRPVSIGKIGEKED